MRRWHLLLLLAVAFLLAAFCSAQEAPVKLKPAGIWATWAGLLLTTGAPANYAGTGMAHGVFSAPDKGRFLYADDFDRSVIEGEIKYLAATAKGLKRISYQVWCYDELRSYRPPVDAKTIGMWSLPEAQWLTFSARLKWLVGVLWENGVGLAIDGEAYYLTPGHNAGLMKPKVAWKDSPTLRKRGREFRAIMASAPHTTLVVAGEELTRCPGLAVWFTGTKNLYLWDESSGQYLDRVPGRGRKIGATAWGGLNAPNLDNYPLSDLRRVLSESIRRAGGVWVYRPQNDGLKPATAELLRKALQ